MMATTNTMMITEQDSSCGGDGDESNNDNGYDFGFEFTEHETEVASILLDLPHLISNSLSFYGFSCAWGSKRRRSAPEIPNPTLPPSTLDICSAVRMPATSPDTPLAFFPCESYAKRPSKRKSPVKRTREELRRMVDQRIETQETLLGEIKKVKLHLEKLEAENHELKTNKQKLMVTGDVSTEKTQLEVSEGSNPLTSTYSIEEERIAVNDYVSEAPSTSTQFHHQVPLIPHHGGFIINPMARVEFDFPGQLRFPLGFDLNVSGEEMVVAMKSALQPLDQKFLRGVIMSKAMAMQAHARAARQRRIQVNRTKKMARVR